MTLPTAGCLVTSVPEHEPPEQTRPFMIESTAVPPTWELLEFTKEGPASGNYPEKPFNVQIVSEDLGAAVDALFYVVSRSVDQSFQRSFAGGRLAAGTLDDEARTLSEAWGPAGNNDPPAGCYSFFWVASHTFDTQTRCPVTATDSSRLTWTMVVCPDSTPCAATELPKCLEAEPEFPCDLEPNLAGGS